MIVYSVPDAVAKIMKKYLEEKANQITLLGASNQGKVAEPIAPAITPIVEAETEPEPEVEPLPSSVELPPASQIVNLELTSSETKKYSRQNSFGDLLECPECGSDLEYAEGCILCRSCGFSKCG